MLQKTPSNPLNDREVHVFRQVMRNNPEMKLCIEGHCDASEMAQASDVSQDRAETVQGYLVQHGIQPARVRAQGCDAELATPARQSLLGGCDPPPNRSLSCLAMPPLSFLLAPILDSRHHRLF